MSKYRGDVGPSDLIQGVMVAMEEAGVDGHVRRNVVDLLQSWEHTLTGSRYPGSCGHPDKAKLGQWCDGCVSKLLAEKEALEDALDEVAWKNRGQPKAVYDTLVKASHARIAYFAMSEGKKPLLRSREGCDSPDQQFVDQPAGSDGGQVVE